MSQEQNDALLRMYENHYGLLKRLTLRFGLTEERGESLIQETFLGCLGQEIPEREIRQRLLFALVFLLRNEAQQDHALLTYVTAQTRSEEPTMEEHHPDQNARELRQLVFRVSGYGDLGKLTALLDKLDQEEPLSIQLDPVQGAARFRERYPRLFGAPEPAPQKPEKKGISPKVAFLVADIGMLIGLIFFIAAMLRG